ncbi:hypothetical protein FE904_14915 [Chryseobacterium indologenes]|uniref:immunity protein Imm33 domain-containing protein n=1 Tax=Chryseobacterium indologenes TaxID=253 RepID=UPI0011096108|nr:hypothetical protein [Chryseobacterium indologenes]TLX24661.1 hypothetical protein FE904_14915 [Chryseobacterium indologenes]
MLTYKDVEININDNIYVKTNGLTAYIGRELRLVNGQNDWDDYVEVIKYIIDYIIENRPTISENQNIGYYSWLLQFRSDEENYYDLYEANSNGSDFNKGCDTAISVVRKQSEICKQKNLVPLFPNFNQSVVISDGVYEGKDIEGIRYESPQDESGWYLITDDYDDNIKSLKMVHFYHVAFARPDILKYLAIPFGYRFIMKEGNIEIYKDDEE